MGGGGITLLRVYVLCLKSMHNFYGKGGVEYVCGGIGMRLMTTECTEGIQF